MAKLKRISEVCKEEGVTRRTLQEYNKIGLLSPTEKTEGGYWLYDEMAIWKLRSIRILAEVGYTRKDIMQVLSSSPEEQVLELDKALVSLQEERKRIDGWIHYIKLSKVMASLSPVTLGVLFMMSSQILTEKNFSEYLNDLVTEMSGAQCWEEAAGENPASENDNYETKIRLVLNFMAVCYMAKIHLKSKDKENLIRELYNVFKELVLQSSEDVEYDPETDEPLILQYFAEFMQEKGEDPELVACLEEFCGQGALDLAVKEVEKFVEQETGRLRTGTGGDM